MNKIISFNELKNNNSIDCKESEKQKVFDLLYELDFENVFNYLDCLVDKYGYTLKICELYATSIASLSEEEYDFEIEKYITKLNEMLNLYKDSVDIALCVSNFHANVFDLLSNDEQEKSSVLLKELYETHKDIDDIAFFYSMNILAKTTTALMSKNGATKEFIKTQYENLRDVFDCYKTDEYIAGNFANFLFFISDVVSDNLQTKKIHNTLKNLYLSFPESDEISKFYASFLSDKCVGKSVDECILYLSELKKINDNCNGLYGISRIYALALSNICISQKYDNSKAVLRELERLTLGDFPDEFITILFAETLSDFSCEDGIKESVIRNQILPNIQSLINSPLYTEELEKEYALILYNLSCVCAYNDSDTSPHLDVMEKLKVQASHSDDAVCYYCLALSNLIHLKSYGDGLKIVDEILAYYNYSDTSKKLRTKNMLSLETILSIAYSNLVHEAPLSDCFDILIKIKKLLNDDDTIDLNIVLSKDANTDDISICTQYIRGLSYYANKQNDIDKQTTLELIENIKNLVNKLV